MSRFARIVHEGRAVYAQVSVDGQSLNILDGEPWSSVTKPTGVLVPSTSATWLPVTAASKVVAIGQNYRKHAQEMGKVVPEEPLIFLKPSTALNAHLADIRLPPASREVHYEGELALVIGQTLARASLEESAAGIFAVTCFNDVTARDIQRREIQHTRAKSYDTFACCGPVMAQVSPDDLRLVCRVNGVVRQDERTSDMVHAPAALVSFISHVMTLLPGDLVSTGTPSGVGPLSVGDVVEVEIEGVGVLRNSVVR